MLSTRAAHGAALWTAASPDCCPEPDPGVAPAQPCRFSRGRVTAVHGPFQGLEEAICPPAAQGSPAQDPAVGGGRATAHPALHSARSLPCCSCPHSSKQDCLPPRVFGPEIKAKLFERKKNNLISKDLITVPFPFLLHPVSPWVKFSALNKTFQLRSIWL